MILRNKMNYAFLYEENDNVSNYLKWLQYILYCFPWNKMIHKYIQGKIYALCSFKIKLQPILARMLDGTSKEKC